MQSKRARQTITTPKKLATSMAGLVRSLAYAIESAITTDADTQLRELWHVFRQSLSNDIDSASFADLYAQTVAYAMFAARLHDGSEQFCRKRAAGLIPRANPFLRKLVEHVSAEDLDQRLASIVDALVDLFRDTNIDKLRHSIAKRSDSEDAFMHFYESFLAHYDPTLRKRRGVWYTPDRIVRFIVRAVDDILKNDLDLPLGLADGATVRIENQEIFRLQVLDPAAGTGTFLSEIVRHIFASFDNECKSWPEYVKRDLLPRLHGYELLPTSHTIAHLKLGFALRDMGRDVDQCFRIFLANALQQAQPNDVRAPVMVVIGNPPYNIVSGNLGQRQREMVDRYKFIDGQRIKEKGALQMEKNLNDDYVKFIALGEQLLQSAEEGIVAYINNDNYLDAPTLRGMRWNLLQSFSSIYIIDLKGNPKRKDEAGDGKRDENVFDIQQGVCINIFVKKRGQSRKSVKYTSFRGEREEKYRFLERASIASLKWENVHPTAPSYDFVPRDFELLHSYENGIRITDLFSRSGTGIITARDQMVIDTDKDAIAQRVEHFRDSLQSDADLCHSLGISLKKGWDIARARQKIKEVRDVRSLIHPILYRPFDQRFVFYHDTLLWTPVKHIMDNFVSGRNIGLVTARSNKSPRADHVFVSKFMTETKCGESTTQSALIPLYVQSNPNLNEHVVRRLANELKLEYHFDPNHPWAHGKGREVTPLDVFDYCYAALHDPKYRCKYADFLRVDFPRVPLPTNAQSFRSLVDLGARLRSLHLLEDPALDDFVTTFPIAGDDIVSRKNRGQDNGWEKLAHDTGRVWINDRQYFAGIPEVAWSFSIGGYQPAQKWLKDRWGQRLRTDDIRHYQRMIVALAQTHFVMERIAEAQR